MRNSDLSLDRLFRAAATTEVDQSDDMPYGFDTRVLAQARTNQLRDLIAVTRFVRRIVLISLGVIALAGAGIYHELRQGDDLGDSLTDEFVIADSAIGSAIDQ
jgi:hypothetical protein